jgi:hypothetical protein
MRRFLVLISLAFLAVPAFAHGHGRGHGVNVNISTDGDEVIDCDDIRVSFDGERVRMTSEDIPFTGKSLELRNEHHGGIHVTGWNGSTYQVRACKATRPGADPNAIRVMASGNKVGAEGPDEDSWIVYYIVRAPRNAVLDLYSTNGGIGVHNVNGTINARAVNGPVSVKESSGTIDAETTNGPISFGGNSGTVRLMATNGPVSVKLDGNGWNDGSLDAQTRNGPVSLKLPRGYRSGIVVETRGGPVTCRAEGCYDRRNARYYDDDEYDHRRSRRIELGSGPQTVRLATTNGPVSIKEAE